MRMPGIRKKAIANVIFGSLLLAVLVQVIPDHALNVRADEIRLSSVGEETLFTGTDTEIDTEEEVLWNPKVAPSGADEGGRTGSKVRRKLLASAQSSASYSTSFGEELANDEEYTEAYRLYTQLKSYYVDGMGELTDASKLNRKFYLASGAFTYTAVLKADGTVSYSDEPSYKESRARLTKNVQSAIDALDYDFPEMYYQYADGYSIHLSRDSESYERAQKEIKEGAESAEVTYAFSAITIKYKEAYPGALDRVGSWRSALAAKAAQIYASAEDLDHDGSIGDAELVKGINDYLCNRFYYDNARLASYQSTKNYQIFGTAAAVFDDVDMGVVCEGYSRSMLAFCQYFNIPCCLIAGNKTSTSGHMWNAVRVDGTWYMVDVTWNDPGYGQNYKYLLRERMSDHREDGRFSKSTVSSYTFAYPSQTDTSFWPRIHIGTLSVGRKKISADSRTLLSIQIEDVSSISEVKAVYTAPETEKETVLVLDYDEKTRSYRAVITVDDETELGTWQLQKISVVNELEVEKNITADQMALSDGNYTVVSRCETDGHTLTEHENVAATCTMEGNSAYWECSACGKYYGDEAASEEIEEGSWLLPVDASCHGEQERRNEKAATCMEEGWSGELYCADCGSRLEEGSTIPVAEHTLTEHEAAAATCIAQGNTAYWECSTCGKYFGDEAASEEIEEGSWIIAKIEQEKPADVSEKPADDTGKQADDSEKTAGDSEKPGDNAGKPERISSGDEAKNAAAAARMSSAKPRITRAKAGKKKITLRWGKIADADGYEINYSLKKNMKSAKKVILPSGKLSRTIKKLRTGKTYYVRIRAYRTINGRKVCSKWSAKKKVSVK